VNQFSLLGHILTLSGLAMEFSVFQTSRGP